MQHRNFCGAFFCPIPSTDLFLKPKCKRHLVLHRVKLKFKLLQRMPDISGFFRKQRSGLTTCPQPFL
ncbi:hypothetical protein CV016_15845 [Yersinia kristensenii]|uniref:Uncharacterized protein n=1 Tax=Yersinia kristensenii TaxID=28152 RepID=A0AB73NK72_YERKR|nr:hypothetical protein CBW52_19285 [Yersinia kristensenii]PHZ34834.1 hypothetical protein CS536_16245 [Yersinia kristensenii]PJE82494.1 hypothetical protein CU276_17925 [Yersinia kristensenii]PJG61763.1 hypothetical protein CV016_15845 [Yersinia kristensenii]